LSLWFGQLASAAASEHALPPTARAPSPPSATPDPEAPLASPRKRKNKKKKKQLAAEGGFGRVALSGRAFVELHVAEANRQRADGDGVVTTSREPVADVGLGSTRLRFDWQSTAPWLSGRFSVDFNTSRIATKDAFLEATGDCALARAGQFKLPTTPFDTASVWSLPLGRHDEFSNTLSEVLFWDRRRPGFLFEAQPLALPVRFVAGIFQGIASTEADGTTPFVDESLVSHLLQVARVEVDPGPIEFGVWGAHRKYASFVTDEPKSYFVGGVDGVGELKFATTALRFWIDGVLGNSWLTVEDKPSNEGRANYALGRALLAFRFGGLQRDAFYVEPFGLFALLDPDLEVNADANLNAVLGVNAGLWKTVRGSLQGELVRAADNTPQAYVASGSRDRAQLLLQVGAAF
jgi:hypothetical protein